MPEKTPEKTIAQNRKAYHDYTILETVEAGLVLTGTEIKSIRDGRVNLRDGYAHGDKGELWLYNAHIARYPGGNRWNHEPLRPRKLLLHKDQIASLLGKVHQEGMTLVPLRLYLKGRVAKIELALAKGKKVYDKREAIARKEAQREMERAIRRKA